ncbi:hypothetical protein [Microbacterium hatanonis]|uniref:Uncharacterized protein n=1 Tax=Microbacterium hatanonis TaxID=404366 RepID=A0A5C8HX93_9MICO|nr:hypothetical protein [Microbacterium hatanonis]TXK09872.1 hypothetical protein FVP77_13385 [Microbacterium hatanonis]
MRRRTARQRGAALLAGALALLALAGCAEAPHPSPSATALPNGITAAVVQLRGDVAARQAEVQIHNGADDTLIIGKVELEDDRLDGLAERVVAGETDIAPGRTVNVRVQLPPVNCDAADEGTTMLEVKFALGAADSIARMPVTDTLGFLSDLHRRECLADALAEVADVTLTGFTPADAGQLGALQVAVAPTGTGTAELVAVHPTPLLMYGIEGAAANHPIDLAVEPGSAATVLQIPLAPQRCDPHVVQEDKRGTVFTFDVVVDGVEGRADIAADPDLKAELLTWVADWCDFDAQGTDIPG